MKIPEGWPTEEMLNAAASIQLIGFVNWDYLREVVTAALEAAPTPAEEEEPVGFTSQSTIEGLKAGKRVQNWILPKKKDDPDFCDMDVPLYARPADTKLRKAAEALIWAYDNHEHCITEIGDLRAALEEGNGQALD